MFSQLASGDTAPTEVAPMAVPDYYALQGERLACGH